MINFFEKIMWWTAVGMGLTAVASVVVFLLLAWFLVFHVRIIA